MKDLDSEIDKILFNFQMTSQTILDMSDYNKIDKKFLFSSLKSLLQLYNSYFNNVIKLFIKYNLGKIKNKTKPSETNSNGIQKHVSKVSFLLTQLFDISLKSDFMKKSLIQVRDKNLNLFEIINVFLLKLFINII